MPTLSFFPQPSGLPLPFSVLNYDQDYYRYKWYYASHFVGSPDDEGRLESPHSSSAPVYLSSEDENGNYEAEHGGRGGRPRPRPVLGSPLSPRTSTKSPRGGQPLADLLGTLFDERRGERDALGRPWYDMQYHDVAKTWLGKGVQYLIQVGYGYGYYEG